MATIGRIEVDPGATNAIAASVRAWLDARAPDEAALTALVESITAHAKDRAARDRTTVAVTAESVSPVVEFDVALRDRLSRLLGAPVLSSAVLQFDIPVLGNVKLVTALFFDLGVYLIVVGLVLDVLRSLGARVDVDMAERQPAAVTAR